MANTRSLILLLVQWLVILPVHLSHSFGIQVISQRVSTRLSAADETGDPLRAATGVRPSIHPVTINALAEALRVRAQNDSSKPLRVGSGVEPLQVAVVAGKIASTAIEKRQEASKEDGMTMNGQEEQTIAGRVIGVVMRFDDLEKQLRNKCEAVGWIRSYSEWGSFGILEDEESTKASKIDERVTADPLFAMNRAECLLAIFLDTVEAPTLQNQGEEVPGGSNIDFLDADRLEVLVTLQ